VVLVTFTDFGSTGPYLGQLRLVLIREAPGVPVVDLLADAPAFRPRASAYLLAALAPELPEQCVCVAVVDPGVGSSSRAPVIVRADSRLFVGPDNGLFHIVAQRASRRERWEILWRPDRLSATFHGRDLFAPVAGGLALGRWPSVRPIAWSPRELSAWPEDLAEIIYLDPYGNAMTGLRADRLSPDARVEVHGLQLPRATTFADVGPGTPFWYENAYGLIELALNQGSVASALGLEVGTAVTVRA
jgi:hypothetical protein